MVSLPRAALAARVAEAEERRLFFVGMTRAQDRLYVSHSARRSRHGAEVWHTATDTPS